MIVAITIWPLSNVIAPMVAQLPQERREEFVAKVFLQDALLLQVLENENIQNARPRGILSIACALICSAGDDRMSCSFSENDTPSIWVVDRNS